MPLPKPENTSCSTRSDTSRYPAPGTYWLHIKTGDIYQMTGVATNCTNAQEGQTLVLYNKPGAGLISMFARELNEFLYRFKKA